MNTFLQKQVAKGFSYFQIKNSFFFSCSEVFSYFPKERSDNFSNLIFLINAPIASTSRRERIVESKRADEKSWFKKIKTKNKHRQN